MQLLHCQFDRTTVTLKVKFHPERPEYAVEISISLFSQVSQKKIVYRKSYHI